jgi:hypothetical protein
VPEPRETVHIDGDVFGRIAIAGVISGLICLVLAPILSRWMHVDATSGRGRSSSAH